MVVVKVGIRLGSILLIVSLKGRMCVAVLFTHSCLAYLTSKNAFDSGARQQKLILLIMYYPVFLT